MWGGLRRAGLTRRRRRRRQGGRLGLRSSSEVWIFVFEFHVSEVWQPGLLVVEVLREEEPLRWNDSTPNW